MNDWRQGQGADADTGETPTEKLRRFMRSYIENSDYESLFTQGGCYFFALVLHEKLHLPLHYLSPPNKDEYAHVFVMRGSECFDYLGQRNREQIAEQYASWSDVQPKSTTIEKVRARISEKQFGESLEIEIMQIAYKQFEARRAEYP